MNEKIQKAMDSNKSRYERVNSYAKNAYTALDDFYTKSSAVSKSAYGNSAAAIKKELANTLEKINEKTAGANSAYTSQKKNAYSKFAENTNDVGVNASSMADTGLENSGYEKTIKAKSLAEYQKELSDAHENLLQSVKSSDKEYVDALVAGDNDLASVSQKMAQDAADLEKEINSMLNQIGSDIADMDYKEQNLEQSNSAAESTAKARNEIFNLTKQLAALKKQKG